MAQNEPPHQDLHCFANSTVFHFWRLKCYKKSVIFGIFTSEQTILRAESVLVALPGGGINVLF